MADGRRERGGRRRAELLSAGIQVVADKGSRALTYRSVARAARSLLTEDSTAISVVFEMIVASRHDVGLSEAAASLRVRLVRHLEASAGRDVDGEEIAACND